MGIIDGDSMISAAPPTALPLSPSEDSQDSASSVLDRMLDFNPCVNVAPRITIGDGNANANVSGIAPRITTRSGDVVADANVTGYGCGGLSPPGGVVVVP